MSRFERGMGRVDAQWDPRARVVPKRNPVTPNKHAPSLPLPSPPPSAISIIWGRFRRQAYRSKGFAVGRIGRIRRFRPKGFAVTAAARRPAAGSPAKPFEKVSPSLGTDYQEAGKVSPSLGSKMLGPEKVSPSLGPERFRRPCGPRGTPSGRRPRPFFFKSGRRRNLLKFAKRFRRCSDSMNPAG